MRRRAEAWTNWGLGGRHKYWKHLCVDVPSYTNRDYEHSNSLNEGESGFQFIVYDRWCVVPTAQGIRTSLTGIECRLYLVCYPSPWRVDVQAVFGLHFVVGCERHPLLEAHLAQRAVREEMASPQARRGCSILFLAR